MEKICTKKYFHEKNIFYVRLELIKDILFSLIDIIDRTYLGDHLMNPKDNKEHFNYCLDVVISNLKDENIHIRKDKELHVFLYDEFQKEYYSLQKSKKMVLGIKKDYSKLFSYSSNKSTTVLKDLTNYYDIFNKNIGDFLAF